MTVVAEGTEANPFGGGSFGTFVFGPGTRYAIVGVEGLDDLPEMRYNDAPRVGRDGVFPGVDLYEARNITVTLAVYGDTPQETQQLLRNAQAVFRRTDRPLPLVLGGFYTDARVRRRAAAFDNTDTVWWRLMDVEFFCPDPVLYSQYENTVSLVTGASEVTGRIYPRTYFWNYPGAQSAVSMGSINNTGSVPVRVSLTLRGLLTNPTVEIVNSTSTKFNYILQPNETITLDRTEWTVRLNGQPRADILAEGTQMPLAPPGLSTVRLNAQPGDTGSLSVVYRSGWV